MGKMYESLNGAVEVYCDDSVKQSVCETRQKRNLVFDDDTDRKILQHSLDIINRLAFKYKITSQNNVIAGIPYSENDDELSFSFSVLNIFAFANGARVKSAILKLTIGDV